MAEVALLWKSCEDALREQVSEAAWKATFDEVRAEEGPDGELVLIAPNAWVRDRIEHRFLSLVRDVLNDVGGSAVGLHLAIAQADEEPDVSEVPEVEDVLSPATSRNTAAIDAQPARSGDAALNPEFTFEAFVIGDANSFAHAAARAAAEQPAKSYNPLFVYGRSGLGKTHLLHAIGNYVRAQYPGRHVQYVSTETFLNEFVDMIRSNAGVDFRRRYRQVDVLLIDDVQFLAGKEGLQEEFFHTFDHLYRAGGQIVLTSDTHPRAIPTLEDRLRSRFVAGLVTDVQPPDLETRLAILRKKSEGERLQPPEEVLDLIATHVKDNIRELEGALTRVIAYASLEQAPLTVSMAERILEDLLSSGDARRITPKLILDAAAEMFGFHVDDLCGPARKRPLVDARQVAMYVMRELTQLSYPSIGEEFGGRDHTTVLHAVQKISDQMKEKRSLYEQVIALRQKVLNGG